MNLLTPRIVAWATTLALLAAALYWRTALAAWAPGPVATFWVLVLTASAALWYGWLTYLLLRKDHTPVVVMSFSSGATIFRNVGHGVALNVVLVERNRTVARAKDLARNECHHVNTTIRWTLDRGRHVFYQDAYGRWYATKCLGQGIADVPEVAVANAFVGRTYNPPKEVRRAALVRDVLEHFVQLNRTWDPRNWLGKAMHWNRKRRAENRLVGMVRRALTTGRLSEPFSAAEMSVAIELEAVVAEPFLANHSPGNADGERVFFERDGDTYRLHS